MLELSGLDQEGMHEKTIKEGLTALQKLRKVKETGIDIKDAKDAIKEVETPEIKTAAKDLYKVQDEGLLYLVRSGFMDAETADVIRDMNRRYVPFYRVMEESTAGKGGGGKTMADLPSPVKGMKGSTREIIDPLESIVKNIYTFINLAERNKVALTLADQADTTEGAGRWVEKVPAKMAPTQFTLEEIQSTLKDAGVEVAKIDKKKLEAVATIFRPMPAGSQRENVISVFRNGKRDLYQVQPDLYKAMQGMDEEVSNIVIRILSKPAKAVRLGFTQANPEFALVNIARDVMLATVQSRNGFTPLDMFRGLSEVVKKSDLFNEFVRSGGMQSAMLSLDRTHLQKNLEDMMASKGKMLVKHPIEALRILGEYSELSTRMGEYRKARKKGKSAATSAFDAREITVDFARIGSSVRALNMIIPFFNATNQSADRLVRAFKEDPTGFSVRAAVGIAIPSLMLYAVNRDNEDYWELPSWKRDFFWMIPTKGTPLEKETPFIGINKPFQLGLMYGSALERGLRWLDTKDPTAFDGLLNSLAQTTIPSPIPAAAMGPLEAWANKSFFTGRDLVPGFMQNLPPQHQFNPWTTDFAKSMSRMAGRVGVPVSPIKLEHSLFSYTGGAGRSAVSIIDPLFRSEATERPTRTLADIPIARRFAVRTAGSTESMQRFYDRLADLDQKRTAEKYAEKYRGSIKPEKMTAKEHREYDLLNSERRRMSGISTRIRKVEFSKKSAEEKRELIDKLSLQRRKIASSTMKRSRKITKMIGWRGDHNGY